MLATGCSGSSSDTGTPEQLPPVDTAENTLTDTIDWNVSDTGLNGSYSNEEPPFELTLQHEGVWELLPLGGPYTSMVGEMTVVELLDGNENTPYCRATFSLTGQVAESTCDSCDVSFLILFYLTDEGEKGDKEGKEKSEVGGLADCQSPDLPADGETRTLGYSDLDSTIYFNYYDSDIWIPWYDANDLHDEVNFSWEETVGFAGDEEED